MHAAAGRAGGAPRESALKCVSVRACSHVLLRTLLMPSRLLADFGVPRFGGVARGIWERRSASANSH